MNITSKFLSLMIIFSLIGFTSCKDDKTEDPVAPANMDLTLSFDGLEDLGSDYVYEGWIMVDGAPKTTGTFTVDANGDLSESTFSIATADLEAATAFILTIEPAVGDVPEPSDVHVLAGDFSGDNASLTIDHGAALGNDFSTSAGTYILATPTDTDANNEESGLWFLDNSSGSPAVGLTLPTLPAGWVYEGWAVVDGTPVSTGTFTAVDMADNASPHNGSGSAPPFPGEDLLTNAPAGLTFPTNLQGGAAVISIEPMPDNSAAPFALKPLVGMIADDAAVHTALAMGQNLVFPTGTATK